MSENIVEIRVSESRSRLVGIAEVDGAKTRYVEKSLADFDQDVVDVGLVSESDVRIRLVSTGAGAIAPSLGRLTEARSAIQSALEERAEAVRESMTALEGLGWSQKDAARVLGLSQNMARSILNAEGTVHGSSVLGDDPAVLDGDDLVVGEWVLEGTELSTVACQIAGMSQRVSQLWAKANGLDKPQKRSSAKNAEADNQPENEGDGSAESDAESETSNE